MQIITVHHPRSSILRRKAKPVGRVTPEVVRWMDEMVEVMRAARGVGLAGPQVGLPHRIVVVEYGGKLYQLADPELVRMEGEEWGREGCLSIPGVTVDLRRASRVVVRAKNRRGRGVTIEAEGWLARIFQHEVDHLDGILITDRAERPEHIHRVEEELEVVG
ncbi:MAG: peptide deformylase [Armatimonadetes bacterium]|nr:peptide deformylase [Armatimonadota bacterium]MDW8153102.1 peptide deformylase [Armatimonadota bacterium]